MKRGRLKIGERDGPTEARAPGRSPNGSLPALDLLGPDAARIDRRDVNLRWLCASALTGLTGAARDRMAQIRERLAGREDIALVQVDPARRKDADARRAAMAETLTLPVSAEVTLPAAFRLAAPAPEPPAPCVPTP